MSMKKIPLFTLIILLCGASLASAATIAVNANFLNTSDFSISGSVSKGSGTFVIDHPLDPKNKLLYHSFVESPDMKNVYTGVATLDGQGGATISLPDYFGALNKEYRYQILPLGEAMPSLHVAKKIDGNTFSIAGGAPRGEVSWMVTGIRKDPYALKHPILPEVEKGPKALMKKGECVFDPLCE